MHTQRVFRTLGALAAFVGSTSSHAWDIREVAHQFLQRHDVPCLVVVRVGSTHELDEVATCQDGREWVLFWLEDEIAFVDPETRQPYRWQRDLYVSYPELYSLSKHRVRDRTYVHAAEPSAIRSR